MAKRQTGKRRANEPEYQTFTFLAENCKTSYSIMALGNPKLERSMPDYLHLSVKGVFLAPARAKGRQCTLNFLADRGLEQLLLEADRDGFSSLGLLTIRGDRTDFLGSLPYDAVWPLSRLLSVGEIKLIQLHGPALRYGRSHITSLHFEREIHPEDW